MKTAPAKAIGQLVWGITLSVIIAFAGTASLAEPEIYSNPDLISDFEYGLICNVDTVGSMVAPDTDIGSIGIIGPSTFSAHSAIVPAMLGLSFGIKVRSAEGVMLGVIKVSITHPPNKQSGTTSESWESSIPQDGGATHLFTFDVPAELVTGEWMLSAYKDGILLYRMTFDVVNPADAPIYLTRLCNGDALTS